ncbi:MAG: MBL fold metallo-hydrolase [Thiotrichales bacterium]
MALRCRSLGSGSKGNATLIETEDTLVLVDCGFTAAEMARRITAAGFPPEALDAILVTHEHADHIRGVDVLSRRYEIPVWLTRGSRLAITNADLHAPTLISSHAEFRIGGLQITPFPVPHDAREPCQFVFSDGDQRVGLLTDVGSITPHILEVLRGCAGLLLEFNYDPTTLRSGPYPEALKRRIDGARGHLSNEQAATLLRSLDHADLRFVVGLHLSEQNNAPSRVAELLQSVANGRAIMTGIADQRDGSAWFSLD